MRSEELVKSVEDLIAQSVAIDASLEIAPESSCNTTESLRVQQIIREALTGAFELVRRQLAEPREGSMTFVEAMDAVIEGKSVTRPGWGILKALIHWSEDSSSYFGHPYSGYNYKGHLISLQTLDNLFGSQYGPGTLYSPGKDDVSATDWMEYQRPVYIDLRDLHD